MPELPFETLKARFDLREGYLAVEKIEISGGYGKIQIAPEVRPRPAAPSGLSGEVALLLTIKGSPEQKGQFPLLWAVVEQLPRAGGSYQIAVVAREKGS